MLLMKHSATDATVNWYENDHQAYIVHQLRGEGALFRVGMEGIKLTRGQAAKAKALGLEAGEPDLLIYGDNGSVLLIELKRWRGVVSPVQKRRHAHMLDYGHKVHIIKERTPADAWHKLLAIKNDSGFVW